MCKALLSSFSQKESHSKTADAKEGLPDLRILFVLVLFYGDGLQISVLEAELSLNCLDKLHHHKSKLVASLSANSET